MLLALTAAGLTLSAGCGGSGFEDRTAEVTISDRTTTYDVESCGLDGDTAFVVARSSGGSVLQAVVGVADEEGTGVPEATGFTTVDDGVTLGAFGAEAWRRRGEDGPPPGSIEEADVTGSRIRLEAGAVPLEEDGTLPSGDVPAAEVSITIDSRCDAPED